MGGGGAEIRVFTVWYALKKAAPELAPKNGSSGSASLFLQDFNICTYVVTIQYNKLFDLVRRVPVGWSRNTAYYDIFQSKTKNSDLRRNILGLLM